VSLCEFKQVFIRSWPHNRISIAYEIQDFLNRFKFYQIIINL